MFPRLARDGELLWAVNAPDGRTLWVGGPGEHAVGGERISALSRTFIPTRLTDNPYLKDRPDR